MRGNAWRPPAFSGPDQSYIGPALVDEQQPLCAGVWARDIKYDRGCIATCSATVALEIAIRALDVSEEVIVPPFALI